MWKRCIYCVYYVFFTWRSFWCIHCYIKPLTFYALQSHLNMHCILIKTRNYLKLDTCINFINMIIFVHCNVGRVHCKTTSCILWFYGNILFLMHYIIKFNTVSFFWFQTFKFNIIIYSNDIDILKIKQAN